MWVVLFKAIPLDVVCGVRTCVVTICYSIRYSRLNIYNTNPQKLGLIRDERDYGNNFIVLNTNILTDLPATISLFLHPEPDIGRVR